MREANTLACKKRTSVDASLSKVANTLACIFHQKQPIFRQLDDISKANTLACKKSTLVNASLSKSKHFGLHLQEVGF